MNDQSKTTENTKIIRTFERINRDRSIAVVRSSDVKLELEFNSGRSNVFGELLSLPHCRYCGGLSSLAAAVTIVDDVVIVVTVVLGE